MQVIIMIFGSQESIGEVITTTRLPRSLTYEIFVRRRRLMITKAIQVSKKSIQLCTWNVRIIFQAEKINNVIAEMNRPKIDIIGISKIRWSGRGKCNIEKH